MEAAPAACAPSLAFLLSVEPSPARADPVVRPVVQSSVQSVIRLVESIPCRDNGRQIRFVWSRGVSPGVVSVVGYSMA
ncbi:hypothetical protein F5X68DRAFT_203659 [Plectosphaerella plurivora]|uniref:Uncharacterized protein n=1 Tax=Plectosphaerella plurivora TaxID=936078 RepID=A0A9P9AAJ9_9PEZI|nr:hypothetical protein F5X68DRAFT_203659 [Plectosphaerella plurivora]